MKNLFLALFLTSFGYSSDVIYQERDGGKIEIIKVELRPHDNGMWSDALIHLKWDLTKKKVLRFTWNTNYNESRDSSPKKVARLVSEFTNQGEVMLGATIPASDRFPVFLNVIDAESSEFKASNPIPGEGTLIRIPTPIRHYSYIEESSSYYQRIFENDESVRNGEFKPKHEIFVKIR